MCRQLASLIKKDIKFIIQSKFYLVILGSLLLYSLYINLVYVNSDTQYYTVYMYNNSNRQMNKEVTDYHKVNSEELLNQKLQLDKESIGIIVNENNSEIIILDSGSNKINKEKQLYGEYLLEGSMVNKNANFRIISNNDFDLKKRIEMVSVIIFFEITTISFLGIAAIFFKEKEMGVLKVYGVLPISKVLILLSKVIIYLCIDIIFVLLMSWINIGGLYTLKISLKVCLQIIILSPILVLLGYFFSVIYKNFKEFGFVYTVVIIGMTSPVFLFTNTPYEWSGIKYFPSYHLYINLQNAFFNKPTINFMYLIISFLCLIALFIVDFKLIAYSLRKGD